MIVNIQGYGDFDVPVLLATMQAPDSMADAEVDKVVSECHMLFSETTNLDTAVAYLKKLGFKVVKTRDFTIGGNC